MGSVHIVDMKLIPYAVRPLCGLCQTVNPRGVRPLCGFCQIVNPRGVRPLCGLCQTVNPHGVRPLCGHEIDPLWGPSTLWSLSNS